eukprot:UN24330
MEITTKTKDDTTGFHLTFDNNGILVKTSNLATSVGTTVTMKKLFYTLPVRYREFRKILKKEYNKMLTIIQAYAIVSKGVQVIMTNTNNRGKKTKIMNVSTTKKMQDRIGAIYGYKIAKGLSEVKTELNCGINMFGYVSDPSLPGRGSGDRQHFFLNSRPVDIPKIQRIINSVFKTYRKKQFPFLI